MFALTKYVRISWMARKLAKMSKSDLGSRQILSEIWLIPTGSLSKAVGYWIRRFPTARSDSRKYLETTEFDAISVKFLQSQMSLTFPILCLCLF